MEKLFFTTPYCQFHPKEKVLRICTNISCQRYFQLACIECLDTHNHNIQELIKIKEFFAQIASQTGGPQMKEKESVSGNSSKKNSLDIQNSQYAQFGNNLANNSKNKNQFDEKQEKIDQQQLQQYNQSEDFELPDGKSTGQYKQAQEENLDDSEEDVQILNHNNDNDKNDSENNNNDNLIQLQQKISSQQNYNQEEFEMIVGGTKQEESLVKFQQPDILDGQILDECFDKCQLNKKQEQNDDKQNERNSLEGNNNQEQNKKQENFVKINQIQTLMSQMSGIIQIAEIIKSDLQKMEDNLQDDIQNSPQGIVNKLLREISQISDNENEFQQNFYSKIEKLKTFLNKDQNKIQVKSNETQEIQQILDVYSNVFSSEIANTFKSLNQLASLDFEHFKKTYSCKFTFSPSLKGKNIILGNGNKVALQQSSEERFIMMEPQINLNIKTRWAFKVLDPGTWIGVGMANKDIIQLEQYQFTKYTGNGRHGSYMFSNNGYSWNYMQQYCNMQMNNFKYNAKEIILLEYNPKYKKLVAINLDQKKVNVMDIQNIESQFKHHPCVNMCYGAKIQILDNFVWPNEQTLKQFSESCKKDFSFLLDYRP